MAETSTPLSPSWLATRLTRSTSRGWERAFQRLEEIREQARTLVGCPELGFWPGLQPKVAALVKIVPETWTGPSDIDLRADGQMLQELTGKVAFVRSLPQPSVTALLEQVDVDFAGVLHRVILALALGRVELVAKKEHVSRFCAECFAEDGLHPHVRRQVLDQLVGHLDNAVADADVRVWIADELCAEIEVLEQAADRGDLAAFFSVPSGTAFSAWGI